MTRILTFFLFFCCLSATSIHAQNFEKSSYFGAKVLFMDYGLLNDGSEFNVTNGVEFLYQKDLARKLLLSIPVRLGVMKVAEDINNRNIGGIDALLQYRFLPDTNRIIPYLSAGGGFVVEEIETSFFQVSVGGGLNFRVGSHSFINLQGELRPSMETNRNGIHIGAGYIYRFRKEDRDQDGVVNHLDQCPDVPGTLDGCPDKDGDRIADQDDMCPEIPGRRSTNGCPDSDRDGITDKDDPCPEVAGRFNGCPDSDGDGVGDDKDECPDERGIIAMGGCPDSDSDGIADKDDQCPNERGALTNGGCPIDDRDGDGVADEDDECPDQKGVPRMRGCPDEDGDGVADKDDLCPDKAGPFSGCPDTDQDGIMDADDKCPDQPGALNNSGCPEIEKEDQEVLDLATEAVQFEKDKATLLNESYAVLDQIIELLNKYPGYKCKISGHTDSSGDEASNQFLSEQRALTCYQYLAFKGIAQNRLSYFGFGETLPRASNDTREGRELNRRVEFELYIE